MPCRLLGASVQLDLLAPPVSASTLRESLKPDGGTTPGGAAVPTTLSTRSPPISVFPRAASPLAVSRPAGSFPLTEAAGGENAFLGSAPRCSLGLLFDE